MIGVIGALPWELAALRRRIQIHRHLRFDMQQLWEGMYRGRQMVLVQSGMGRARAEEATTLLLDRFALSELFCVGFGGGVSGELQGGDVVLCGSVYRAGAGADPKEWTLEEGVRSDAGLMTSAAMALGKEGMRFHQGDGLTVDRVISDPGLKRRIGEVLAIKVLDMESFWVARLATGRVGRVLLARAITDSIDHRLPSVTGAFGSSQKNQIERVALHVLQRPRSAVSLLRLALNARRAARNLGQFVTALVEQL